MSTLDDVLQYRERVERSQRNVAMAEGALKREMTDLLKQFQCKTVEAGRRLLRTLTHQRDREEREAGEKLEIFKEKWKEHLE